jgi:hypothetical protein
MREKQQRRLETVLWIAAIAALGLALLLIEPVRERFLIWVGVSHSEPMTGLE